MLDIDAEEFRASYSKELAGGGQAKANARVAECLYRKAVGEGRESVTAAIFWLKGQGPLEGGVSSRARSP